MRPPSLLLAIAVLSACGGPMRTGTRADAKIGDADPVSHAEIVIRNLSRSDAEAFRAHILAQGGIENVVLKSYANGVATYELDIRGCECDLPAKIARIPAPGFKYEGRKTRLDYSAYDNVAPRVTFIHPEDGRVLSDPEQLIALEVKDSDVADVRVNGVKAEHYRGDVWLARLSLDIGSNRITAKVKDKAGNEAPEAKVVVTVAKADTPETAVRIVVEGRTAVGSTVMIEGKEVAVDANGRYRKELSIRRGQQQVEIIALDATGKKSVTVKEIGD